MSEHEAVVVENELDVVDTFIKRTMFSICSGFYFAMAAQIIWFILVLVYGTVISVVAVRYLCKVSTPLRLRREALKAEKRDFSSFTKDEEKKLEKKKRVEAARKAKEDLEMFEALREAQKRDQQRKKKR